MSRDYDTGFTYEDVLSDLEHAQKRIAEFEHVFAAVQSALEDGAANLALEVLNKARLA